MLRWLYYIWVQVEDFSKDKEIFDFRNYSINSKYYDDSSKLVVVKMKYERGGVAIKEFVWLISQDVFLFGWW